MKTISAHESVVKLHDVLNKDNVAVTGLGQPATERLFRESGADVFLPKPVELKELLAAVAPAR